MLSFYFNCYFPFFKSFPAYFQDGFSRAGTSLDQDAEPSAECVHLWHVKYIQAGGITICRCTERTSSAYFETK